MRPVHEFKANVGDTAPSMAASHDEGVPATEPAFYEADAAVRNLCLVWDNGRRAFFNYAYLVAADFTLQDGRHKLLLSFGSYTVQLKGYGLEMLFEGLLEHVPRMITAIDPRYISQLENLSGVVTDIIVKSD